MIITLKRVGFFFSTSPPTRFLRGFFFRARHNKSYRLAGRTAKHGRQKGYYLFSSDTSVRVGMNTMCVSKKSSKHGSFLEPATFVLLSLCSSRCSRIFCGVPAMIMYLKQTARSRHATRRTTTVSRHTRRERSLSRQKRSSGCLRERRYASD